MINKILAIAATIGVWRGYFWLVEMVRGEPHYDLIAVWAFIAVSIGTLILILWFIANDYTKIEDGNVYSIMRKYLKSESFK